MRSALDGSDLLDNILRRVQVNEALVDPAWHLHHEPNRICTSNHLMNASRCSTLVSLGSEEAPAEIQIGLMPFEADW